MLRNHILVVTTLFVFLSLTACLKDEKAVAPPPPVVEVITLKRATVPVNKMYVGQTEGSNAVEVRAQVSGILMKRTYIEGDYVTQGDVLFEIEPDTYKAALLRAEGSLAQTNALQTQAQQTLNRIRPLYKQNAVSQQDLDNAQAAFDAARADVKAAKAAVTEAEIQLAYAYVKAPVSGYTSKEYRSIGNLISSTSDSGSLLTVVNTLNPMYVNFSISSPEYMEQRRLIDAGLMRIPSMKAELIINDIVYDIKGDISFTDRQVNPTTSVIAWRATFENPNDSLLPGQFARIKLIGPELIDAIMVPQQAIIQTQQGPMVIVVNNKNVAEYCPIKTSYSIGDLLLLEEGLEEGERIIVEGLNKVRPGAPVTIKEPAPEAMAETSASEPIAIEASVSKVSSETTKTE